MAISMKEQPLWYKITNIEILDTPALVVYKKRVEDNVKRLIQNIDDVTRLRPHIKTHKVKEVVKLMQSTGIQKFKCATIAEAELLGICAAEDILLAYQPVNNKLWRFIELIKQYPKTLFSCLVDSKEQVAEMSKMAFYHQVSLSVWIDINGGMNRTGIDLEEAFALFLAIQQYSNIIFAGFHLYDGHIREQDFVLREQKCNELFEQVEVLSKQVENVTLEKTKIVAGGTATFPIHAKREAIECSPGTFIYWDKGYADSFPEQAFDWAALVVSTVVSIPQKNHLCLDLGYKAIASENPLPQRIYFLNEPEAVCLSHSEEHLVIKVPETHTYKVGDIFYGVPYHICPTCALYEDVTVVENYQITHQKWQIIARNRKISI
ncbi:MAG: D-TA family PLP-dependent enzyme [Arcicella sp.]|jgi:D-serine deaminase-like pyridoxal phosphate-dependent protein|nr:D-TA family PLP-dependent enzyme [Arcicella sp.]